MKIKTVSTHRHTEKFLTTLITISLIITSFSGILFISSIAKAIDNPDPVPNQDLKIIDDRDDDRGTGHKEDIHGTDNYPPIVRVYPTSRDWSSRPIKVYVLLYDTGSGLSSYSYGWGDSQDPSSVGNMSFPTQISGRFYRFIATKDDADGKWYLHIWVTDEAGNEQQTCNGPYKLDQTSPEASIIINDDNKYTNSKNVILTLEFEDEHSGVEFARYSNDRKQWTEWETPESSIKWSLTKGDEQKTVYYQVIDAADNIAETSDDIILDSHAPECGIVINEGEKFTNSSEVTLFLKYDDEFSGVYQVRYSNDRGAYTDWEEPLNSRDWVLNDGDGKKFVQYQIKDYAGNTNEASDSIILDTTAPSIDASPESQTLDANNTNPKVNVKLTIEDEFSGVDSYRYVWSENKTEPSEDWSNWESYSKPVHIIKGDHGVYFLHVETKDKLGNTKSKVFGPYELNSAPTGDIDLPENEVGVSSTVTLSANVVDDTDIIDYSWDLNDDGENDFYGDSFDYTFNLTCNYTIKLTATDENGAKSVFTKHLNVKETNVFTSGLNYYVWKKNNSILASDLAAMIGLQTDDSILLFNDSLDVCDWTNGYIVGQTKDEYDFIIQRKDVLKIILDGDNRKETFVVTGDSLNVYVNKTLKYVTNSENNNHGYNAVAWTEEKPVRASSIAASIQLEDFQTISVYNKNAGNYNTYIKLPNDDNVGIDALDPWIHTGASFIVKVKNNFDKDYLTTNIDIGDTIGIDEPE